MRDHASKGVGDVDIDGGIVVLLDVDGTLVDSVWLHTVAWATAFARAGHDVPAHRIHPLVGMGADRMVASVVGEPDPAIADAHAELHLARRDELRPLPGARDLVRRLHERGARPVLASSASEQELDVARAVLDVDRWVVGRTTSDDAERSKPAPDIFAAALAGADADAGHAVAVGDTSWDAEAAGALGVPFVGLETGGARRAELTRAGAAAVCTDPRDLLDAVEAGLLGRLVSGRPAEGRQPPSPASSSSRT